MTRLTFALLLSLHGLVTAASPVSAQPLPPPSRTVFKCDQGGKTIYSDSPCLGAQQECRRLDTHLPPLERQELQTSGIELAAVQQQLFALRKRFRELGC